MTRQAARGAGRLGAATLAALLAILLQALIPPGYMLAAGDGAGRAPTLTICTGHGPLKLAAPSDRQAPDKSKSTGVCAFAGHGAPPIPVSAAGAAPVLWNAIVAGGPVAHHLVFVGRGLAAPPPARGPPAALV